MSKYFGEMSKEEFIDAVKIILAHKKEKPKKKKKPRPLRVKKAVSVRSAVRNIPPTPASAPIAEESSPLPMPTSAPIAAQNGQRVTASAVSADKSIPKDIPGHSEAA